MSTAAAQDKLKRGHDKFAFGSICGSFLQKTAEDFRYRSKSLTDCWLLRLLYSDCKSCDSLCKMQYWTQYGTFHSAISIMLPSDCISNFIEHLNIFLFLFPGWWLALRGQTPLPFNRTFSAAAPFIVVKYRMIIVVRSFHSIVMVCCSIDINLVSSYFIIILQFLLLFFFKHIKD